MKLITLEYHYIFKTAYIFNYLVSIYGKGESTNNLRIRDITYPNTSFKPMKDNPSD